MIPISPSTSSPPARGGRHPPPGVALVPADVWLLVLTFLPCRETLLCSRVSRAVAVVCNDVWRVLLLRDLVTPLKRHKLAAMADRYDGTRHFLEIYRRWT